MGKHDPKRATNLPASIREVLQQILDVQGMLHGAGVSAAKLWETILTRRWGRKGFKEYLQNRVIRIADGDVPKPILTGIPKGATGNMGALIFTSPTTLMVLTGDAGDPARGVHDGDVRRLGDDVLAEGELETCGSGLESRAVGRVAGDEVGVCLRR